MHESLRALFVYLLRFHEILFKIKKEVEKKKKSYVCVSAAKIFIFFFLLFKTFFEFSFKE
jgi:hypothetical protein